MQRRRGTWTGIGVLAFGAAALMAPRTDAGGGPLSARDHDGSLAEAVLVERVVWPIVIEPAGCPSMSPDQVVVTEDGRRCPTSAIDRDQPARVHTLLLDNSASMEPQLDHLKSAAIEYIRSCPDDEPIFVTSFANNVVLESGPHDDRASQISAVQELAPGSRTALLDALYYMMRYVEPRPERKVVIVFTDTFDNASLGRHNEEQLLALARSIPGLSVFVIHLKNKHAQLPNSRALLLQLATETGGAYFRVKRAANLAGEFQAIRSRLDSQSFVTYSPSPFGEGRLDDAKRQSFRLRKVEVSAEPGSPCRVASAGPPTRLVGRRYASPEGLSAVAPARGELVPPEVVDLVRPAVRTLRITEKLRFPTPSTWPSIEGEASSFYVVEPPTHLFGRTMDILEEKGARYDARQLAEQGRYLTRLEAAPVFATRDFAVALPPLPYLKRQIRSPIDVMAYLMDSGALQASQPEEQPSGRHPLLIHGQAWLELRRYLSQAMNRAREDYRSWADTKLDSQHRSHVDHLLAEYAKQNTVPHGEIDILRQALLEQVSRPGPASTHGLLAEWLGDVSALELALGLQVQVANRMLRSEAPHGRDPGAFPSVWADLRAWFPPPTHVRTLALLAPAYDPRRDIIGFYRVVLPRFRAFAPPVNPLPERPFGIEIVEWLLSNRELAAELRTRAEVTGIRSVPAHLVASPAEGALHGQRPHGAFETTVEFNVDGQGSFSVIALHNRRSSTGVQFDLDCLRTSGTATELAEHVASAIHLPGLDCKGVTGDGPSPGADAEVAPSDLTGLP